MSVDSYYRGLYAQRAAIVEACIADEPTFSVHTTSHNFLKDFSVILGALGPAEARVFKQACREYQYSLEAVLMGNYRHAFASLRLSFELFIGSIYFSANQMHLQLWIAGHDDLQWGRVNDPDKGVFSHNFVRAFAPDFGPYRTQYLNLSNTVYRECSEYVHGNPGTHENPDAVIGYRPELVVLFHDKVETVRLCVAFAFVVRYISTLSVDSRTSLEALLLEIFGDLPEVQAVFSGPAE